MKRVCAWCKKDLGTFGPGGEESDAPVTHGICGKCMLKVLSSKLIPLEEFLEELSGPVFLLNSAKRVTTGNNAGFSLLGKKSEAVDGKLSGEVFECKNAGLPGGCGHTANCSMCTIRKTVTHTMTTGESRVKVPAYLELRNAAPGRKVRFLISTEKIGDAVLLRIDDVREEEKPGKVFRESAG